MVAAKKVRCVVVVAEPASKSDDAPSVRHASRLRPSDLLPWADPHIRSLVEQLQREVRDEEAQRRDDGCVTAPEAEFALSV